MKRTPRGITAALVAAGAVFVACSGAQAVQVNWTSTYLPVAIGGGDSWDNGLNWSSTPSKPTSSDLAYWNLPGSTAKAVFLDTSQSIGSIQNAGTAQLSIRGTGHVPANTTIKDNLTIATGDVNVTGSGGIGFGVNIDLGDNLAIWNTSTGTIDVGYWASGGAGWPGIVNPIRATVPNTTLRKIGTGYIYLRASGPNIGVQTLDIQQGELRNGQGNLGTTAKKFNVLLGSDNSLLNWSAQVSDTRGVITYPDITVVAGATGTRTLSTAHGFGGGTWAGNIQLNTDLIVSTGGPTYFTGNLTGTGSINNIRTNAGTPGNVRVTGGTVTYSGKTTINKDAWIVDTTTSGQDNYTVMSGAALGGEGTIGLKSGAYVKILNGGYLLPGSFKTTASNSLRVYWHASDPSNSGNKNLTDSGNKIGTLTINGNLLLTDNSNLLYRLGDNDLKPYDTVVLNSTLTLDGRLNIENDTKAGFDTVDGVYTLFTYSGTLVDQGLDLGDWKMWRYDNAVKAPWSTKTGLPGSPFEFWGRYENLPFPTPASIVTGNGKVNLVFGVVIPEPGTLLLLGSGALGILGCFRRRRMR